MAEVPSPWLEEFQERVRVLSFYVRVHKAKSKEYAAVRPVMKYVMLANGEPEGCYYRTGNQGQLLFRHGAVQTSDSAAVSNVRSHTFEATETDILIEPVSRQ